MAESEYASDLKSDGRKLIRVQLPFSAKDKIEQGGECLKLR